MSGIGLFMIQSIVTEQNKRQPYLLKRIIVTKFLHDELMSYCVKLINLVLLVTTITEESFKSTSELSALSQQPRIQYVVLTSSCVYANKDTS